MAKPLRPFVRGGGYYPSKKWIPLVYSGGYTTMPDEGEQPVPILKTAVGNPIHITDALAKPIVSLKAYFSPVQSGSGDPSPDNVRPISGWTGANIYDEAEYDPTASPKIALSWTSQGTQYDGYATIAEDGSVVLTATHTSQTITGDDLDLAQNIQPEGNLWRLTLATSLPSTVSGYHDALCNSYKVVKSYSAVNSTNGSIALNYADLSQILIRNSSFTTRQEIIDGLNTSPIQIVYELATPVTYTLTDITPLTLLQGENNIWSDTNGSLTLTYYADGNTSDEEALNLLLGGRYVNNHTDDEPSDREALNIILGGNNR